MPAGGRFGPQALAGPFSHMQQSHLSHHNNQHHPPGSAGLPPPSFNTHSGFPHATPNASINPFSGVSNANGLAAGFGSGAGLGTAGGTGLASSAAMMSFVQAPQHTQTQSRDSMRRGGGMGKGKNQSRIREVWQGNLAQEMQNLRELVEKYPYISMDTEFPGVVARPMGQFTSRADYHYQTLRTNVDLLSVIQLGITLFTEDGEVPPPHPENGPYHHSSQPCPHTWQFNFRFNQEVDMFNQESIDFLASVGMQMEMHELQGIDPKEFGAMLITSGLAMFDDVRWISFHSGYDFGYLVKLMYCKPLPEDETEYRKLLTLYFPAIFDIKYMVKSAQKGQSVNGNTPLAPTASNILANLGTKSGLQDLADELGIKRVGTAHQAGSDSLLTGKVFWEVKKLVFGGLVDEGQYIGQVWGLNGLLTAANSNTSGIEGQNTPNLNGATIYGNNVSPSTPNTTHSGLAQTPSQQTPANGGTGGSLTPGVAAGGGGVYGRYGPK